MSLQEYLKLFDDERHLRRMRGDRWRSSDEDARKILKAQQAVWKKLTTEERAQASQQEWRSDPALFDARPDSKDVPRYWYDIPQFPKAAYGVDIEWDYLERSLAGYTKDYDLDLNPDFQREHVWTKEQQRLFVEYQLQGGELGRTLIFTHPSWNSLRSVEGGRLEILDGKQRLEAVRAFLRDEVDVFGRRFSEWSGKLRMVHTNFRFNIVELQTRADILRVYLSLNAGGTPHTADELNRVRKMLRAEEGT